MPELQAIPPASHAEPTEGGSYTRDPITGALTLTERTEQSAPADAPAQAE
jgi:hypothetical protein